MTRLRLREALSLAEDARSRGEGAVIATIVGSTRIDTAIPGNRLVFTETGEVHGDIEPGLDALLSTRAHSALEARRSVTRSYRWTEGIVQDIGVQGGDVDVFFEVVATPPHLVIVGAGHIAVPMAKVAKLLDFEVTVVDDRQEYANSERFPDVDRLLLGPYRATLATVTMTRDTSVVLVTRGHVHDQACLEQIADSPAGYIGMIGSKRRVRTVLRHAIENGVDIASLEHVYAPVGLDIAAQTPEEIAVAIMAEIINVRRGGHGRSLALRDFHHV